MRFRTTLIAGLVLVVLGTCFYFFEYKRTREKEATAEKEKKVLSLDWDKLKGFRLVNGQGSFLLDREPKAAGEEGKGSPGQVDWRILEPVKAEADGSALNGMVSTLKELKVEQVVTDAPQDLAPFGLQEPGLRIEMLVPEGEPKPPALLVGGKSPVGFNSYAMREGENKVLLLSTSLDTQFDKKLVDLREKRLFQFSKESVESVRILHQGQPWLEVVKDQDKWDLTTPLRAPASEDEVSKLINKLIGLRVQSFKADDTVDLTPYGLAIPEWSVEVSLAPDHTRASLLVGSTAKEEGKEIVYAKRGETPAVVSLAGDLLASLEVKPEQLREKKVFAFKSWNVQKVEIATRDTPMITLVKKDAGKWRMEAPLDARAAASKVTTFLSSLSRLEGQDFLPAPGEAKGLADYGLSPPLARVAVYGREDRPEGQAGEEKFDLIGAVLLGRSEPNPDGCYAMKEGGSTIARVGKDFFEKELPQKIADLQDRKLLDVFRYQVASIEYHGPEGALLLERKESGWKLREPEKRDVDEKSVDDLITVLTDLETARFIEPGSEGSGSGETAALPGLEPPALKVCLKSDKGEELGTLLVSDKGPADESGFYYAKNGAEKWTGLIEEPKRKQLADRVAPFFPRASQANPDG